MVTQRCVKDRTFPGILSALFKAPSVQLLSLNWQDISRLNIESQKIWHEKLHIFSPKYKKLSENWNYYGNYKGQQSKVRYQKYISKNIFINYGIVESSITIKIATSIFNLRVKIVYCIPRAESGLFKTQCGVCSTSRRRASTSRSRVLQTHELKKLALIIWGIKLNFFIFT